MRRRRRSRIDGPKAEINMNSLIDLTFLLLVTFMLTLPALEQGITVLLPKGKTDKLPAKNNKAYQVTIDYEKKLYFDRQPVTLAELEEILAAKVKEDEDVPVLVRGDERLEYADVMDVVKTVYKSKVRRMSLVTVEK